MTLIMKRTVGLSTVTLHAKTSEIFCVGVHHKTDGRLWKKDGAREESTYRFDGVVTGLALAAGARPKLLEQEDEA